MMTRRVSAGISLDWAILGTTVGGDGECMVWLLRELC